MHIHTGIRCWLAGVLSLILVQASVLKADTLPTDVSGEQGYSSILEAVKAASDRYNPLSIATDTEHFGAILRTMGNSPTSTPRFTYSHSAARRGQDSFRFKVKLVKGEKLVAIWHTHGRRHPVHRFFSASDVTTAHKLGLPFYLADYTGSLKVYDPAREVAGFSAAKTARRITSGRSKGAVVKDIEYNAVRIRVR